PDWHLRRHGYWRSGFHPAHDDGDIDCAVTPEPICIVRMGATVKNGPESFSAYLDESEETSIGVYAVGGFVGKAEVWERLTAKWLDCLPAGITCFHATDCFTGNKQFEGVDIPQRVRILDKLTDVVLAHEVRLVGYGLDANTY